MDKSNLKRILKDLSAELPFEISIKEDTPEVADLKKEMNIVDDPDKIDIAVQVRYPVEKINLDFEINSDGTTTFEK